jgi:hypothetical protein
MKIAQNLNRWLSANPASLLALGLFLFAEYHLYQRGKELTLVCREFYEAPLVPIIRLKPRTDHERAEMICLDRAYD